VLFYRCRRMRSQAWTRIPRRSIHRRRCRWSEHTDAAFLEYIIETAGSTLAGFHIQSGLSRPAHRKAVCASHRCFCFQLCKKNYSNSLAFDVRHPIIIFLILAFNTFKIYHLSPLNALLQTSYLRSLKL